MALFICTLGHAKTLKTPAYIFLGVSVSLCVLWHVVPASTAASKRPSVVLDMNTRQPQRDFVFFQDLVSFPLRHNNFMLGWT